VDLRLAERERQQRPRRVALRRGQRRGHGRRPGSGGAHEQGPRGVWTLGGRRRGLGGTATRALPAFSYRVCGLTASAVLLFACVKNIVRANKVFAGDGFNN
jgi:hypothetical protein